MADLDYSAMTFDGAVDAMRELLRRKNPRYTEQDPHDLLNDIVYLAAYGMVRDGALADRAAEDRFWSTFRTRSGAIALASELGIRLSRENPASVDVVARVTTSMSGGPTLLLSDRAQISTRAADGSVAVGFEQDGDIVSNDTAFDGAENDGGDVFMYAAGAGTFTDLNDSGDAALWAAGAKGDATYFGHPQLQFTELALTFSSYVTEPGVWEVYDPTYSFAPGPHAGGSNSAVRDMGDGTLRMRLDTYTGAADYSDGVWTVEVLCLATGVSEWCVVKWDSGNSRNYIDTATLLGQQFPSTTASAYLIRPYWTTPANLVDGTDDGAGPGEQDGSVTFDLPQSATRQWAKTEVNGVSAYWLRVRRAGGSGTDSPEIATVAGGSVDDGRWWLMTTLYQGETVVQSLGDGDGTSFQTATLNDGNAFVEGSLSITVAGNPWTQVATLYGTSPSSQVFMLVERPDGSLVVRFGNGLIGAVPQTGEAIEATFRIGATTNGNVGADTVTQPQQTTTGLDGWTNPRSASGWSPRDGFDDDDMERLRLTIPGRARAADKIVTPEDAEYHAVYSFRTSDGRAPIARADAYESTTDASTVEVYVVGPGGASVSAADLEEFETYCNGSLVGMQRRGRRMLANQLVDARNATLVEVPVTITITVLTGYSGGVAAAVRSALRSWLSPLATESGRFVHRSGGRVSWHRLGATASSAARSKAGDGFVDITLTAPAASVDLEAGELPTPGAISVSVVEGT